LTPLANSCRVLIIVFCFVFALKFHCCWRPLLPDDTRSVFQVIKTWYRDRGDGDATSWLLYVILFDCLPHG